MRSELLDGVEKHSVVNITQELEGVSIIRRLEAYCFQDSDTTVDLGHAGLHSGVS